MFFGEIGSAVSSFYSINLGAVYSVHVWGGISWLEKPNRLTTSSRSCRIHNFVIL